MKHLPFWSFSSNIGNLSYRTMSNAIKMSNRVVDIREKVNSKKRFNGLFTNNNRFVVNLVVCYLISADMRTTHQANV